MSSPVRPGWDPSSGVFGRVTAASLWLLTVEAAFLLAAAPGIAGILLLDRDPSNIPLYTACALPFGPAISAAVFALRTPPWLEDFGPWRRYWRGWRMNLRQVLAVWVPTLALAGVAGFNLAFSTATGADGVLVPVGALLAAVVLVWSVAALVVISLFRFRTVDALRVTLYALGVRPQVTVGVLSLLLLAAATVAFTSDWVLAITGVLFLLALVQTTRPVVRVVEERFVAAG